MRAERRSGSPGCGQRGPATQSARSIRRCGGAFSITRSGGCTSADDLGRLLRGVRPHGLGNRGSTARTRAAKRRSRSIGTSGSAVREPDRMSIRTARISRRRRVRSGRDRSGRRPARAAQRPDRRQQQQHQDHQVDDHRERRGDQRRPVPVGDLQRPPQLQLGVRSEDHPDDRRQHRQPVAAHQEPDARRSPAAPPGPPAARSPRRRRRRRRTGSRRTGRAAGSAAAWPTAGPAAG